MPAIIVLAVITIVALTGLQPSSGSGSQQAGRRPAGSMALPLLRRQVRGQGAAAVRAGVAEAGLAGYGAFLVAWPR